MKALNIFVGILLITFSVKSQDHVNGKTVFEANCQACHSIGGGKVVGPDLKGLEERRKEEWAIRFIKSPMKMIKEGDETAVKLFEEYNNIPMPDQSHLKDAEILDLLAFIKEKGKPAAPVADKSKDEVVNPSPSKPEIVYGALEYTLISFAGLALLIAVLLLYILSRLLIIIKNKG